jgi:hypothetical protein
MGSHPINLAFRFILELTALISAGMWGWRQTEGWLQIALALGIPILLAAIWGIFAVPNDPSRSGAAPVKTPGIIRLMIELVFFAFATWFFYDMGFLRISLLFCIMVIVHYSISYDRIMWLISKKTKNKSTIK